MKLNAFASIVIIIMAIASCSDNPTETVEPDDKPTEIEKSDKKDLLSLILDYDNVEYGTNITNNEVVNIFELPFLAEQFKIKSFQISEHASINLNANQILGIEDTPFVITVTAENGSKKDYSLSITKDEGLQIEPNMSIENGSSFTLQSSDVYVDLSQLTRDFDRFHISTYADFNNDGNTDVLIASGLFKSYEYSPISLYLGDGSGNNANFCECGGECSNYTCNSFTELPNASPAGHEGFQHPRKILTGDYNGDNLIDAFIIGHGYDAPPFPGESPVLLLNNGNGFSYNKLDELSGFFHGGSSADFDNDGDIDIFINGTPSTKEAVFLVNDGSGNFEQTSDFIDEDFHQNTSYYTSEFIDINSDGYIDLLLGGHEYEGAITSILWGNSSGKYYKSLSTSLPQVSGYGIVVDIDAIDIDGDGDKDILLNRVNSDNFYQGYFLQVIENTNTTNFSDITSNSISNNTGSDWYIWAHIQDLNKDGIPDIYLENDHMLNLKLYGDGNGNFSK